MCIDRACNLKSSTISVSIDHVDVSCYRSSIYNGPLLRNVVVLELIGGISVTLRRTSSGALLNLRRSRFEHGSFYLWRTLAMDRVFGSSLERYINKNFLHCRASRGTFWNNVRTGDCISLDSLSLYLYFILTTLVIGHVWSYFESFNFNILKSLVLLSIVVAYCSVPCSII